MMNESKGMFRSHFGFLMSAIGVAIGLGNIWGFPYKMGANGGFAFLLIYVVMAVFIGYPLLLAELSLGRKTGKAAVEAFQAASPKFKFVGVFETLVPFLLLCFYCVLGGVVIKYTIANFGDIIGASFGMNGVKSNAFFQSFVSDTKMTVLFTLLFLLLTSYTVFRGIENGIEKFCAYGMPLLFLMLLITVVKCCTLPHGMEGIKFMFKPDFKVFAGTGWFKAFAMAGGQMFFSISLASGALIAYGSYMKKDADLDKSAKLIPVFDTLAALLAGLAVFPAVFSEGLPPTGGPGLLFVSLQTVFNSMGSVGPIFGFIFYLLVFVAAFSSSIEMMEGGISAIMDSRIKRNKGASRPVVVLGITITTILGSTLVALDQLGGNQGMWKPFGLGSWLDVFDLGGEGILMPLGGFFTAILFGWVRRGFLDDEIESSSPYKSKGFVHFCMRWIAPVFMAFVVFIQISNFFFSNTAWYRALLG